jgi:hypothetical protein
VVVVAPPVSGVEESAERYYSALLVVAVPVSLKVSHSQFLRLHLSGQVVHLPAETDSDSTSSEQ